MREKSLSALLKVLPKNYLSYGVGKLSEMKLPPWLNRPLLSWFASRYGINLSEVEKEIGQYPSLSEFFVRQLKAGSRPIQDGIVHPSDSTITQLGLVERQTLIQAKGLTYNLSDLLQDTKVATELEGGVYATYYLCPADYHCVHSPVDGEVFKVTHVPGELWPVNTWSVSSVKNLFPRNERLVIEMKSEGRLAVMVMVGATNVGKMSLSFDSIVTNQPNQRKLFYRTYSTPIKIKKGELVGRFHLGSTVVMIYEPGLLPQNWNQAKLGQVKYGQSFI